MFFAHFTPNSEFFRSRLAPEARFTPISREKWFLSANCKVVPFYKARLTGYIAATIHPPEQN